MVTPDQTLGISQLYDQDFDISEILGVEGPT